MRTLKIFVGLIIVVASQTAAAQTHFPVVSRAEQLDRDLDRRAILLAELKEEQVAFAKAKADYGDQPDDAKADAIRRHGQNINALWRELKNRTPNEKEFKGHRRQTTSTRSALALSQPRRTDIAPKPPPLGTRPKSPLPWVILADGAEAISDRSSPKNEATAAHIPRNDSKVAVAPEEAPFVQIVND
ncbi:MAG: hypothetical protein ACXWC4_00765 [Telluria sp.]